MTLPHSPDNKTEGQPFSDDTHFSDGTGFKQPKMGAACAPAPHKDAEAPSMDASLGGNRISEFSKRSRDLIEHLFVYILKRPRSLFKGAKRLICLGKVGHGNMSPLKFRFIGDVAGRTRHMCALHQI